MLFKSVVAQEIGFFDKTSTGELINRLSTDTSKIGQSLTSNISDGLRSFVQVIGGFGMMVIKLTLLCFVRFVFPYSLLFTDSVKDCYTKRTVVVVVFMVGFNGAFLQF